MVAKIFVSFATLSMLAAFTFLTHRGSDSDFLSVDQADPQFPSNQVPFKLTKRSLKPQEQMLPSSKGTLLTSNDTYNLHNNNQRYLKRRLPQAIIIGVKKGGTRALLEYLRLHPDVKSPGPEVHFFDRYYDRGLEWYRRQMPPSLPGQMTIEKTPSYFVSHEVPARIAQLNSGIKLLLVVRDPITRALSDYSQNAAKMTTEMAPFSSYAFTNESSCEVNSHWGAVRLGLYWRFLRKWLAEFPLKNIHVVSGERLISRPAAEMEAVEQFLGLRPVITASHFYFNVTKGFPCLKKAESNGRPKCLGKTKGRVHPIISDEARKCLRDFYRPHNKLFAKITGRKFPWA